MRAALLFQGVKNSMVHNFGLVIIWNYSSHEILEEIVLVLDTLFVCHYNSSLYILVKLTKIVNSNKSCLAVVVNFYGLVNEILIKIEYKFLGPQECRKSYNHYYEREKHSLNSPKKPSKHE